MAGLVWKKFTEVTDLSGKLSLACPGYVSSSFTAISAGTVTRMWEILFIVIYLFQISNASLNN